jgi:hypothetical protein
MQHHYERQGLAPVPTGYEDPWARRLCADVYGRLPTPLVDKGDRPPVSTPEANDDPKFEVAKPELMVVSHSAC